MLAPSTRVSDTSSFIKSSTCLWVLVSVWPCRWGFWVQYRVKGFLFQLGVFLRRALELVRQQSNNFVCHIARRRYRSWVLECVRACLHILIFEAIDQAWHIKIFIFDGTNARPFTGHGDRFGGSEGWSSSCVLRTLRTQRTKNCGSQKSICTRSRTAGRFDWSRCMSIVGSSWHRYSILCTRIYINLMQFRY